VGRKKSSLTDGRIDPSTGRSIKWRESRAKRSPMPEPLWRAAAVELVPSSR